MDVLSLYLAEKEKRQQLEKEVEFLRRKNEELHRELLLADGRVEGLKRRLEGASGVPTAAATQSSIEGVIGVMQGGACG
jgi:predicted RNase H-like nuclease (RuvC/YqgF family)